MIKSSKKSFEQYVHRFEEALILVVNPDQYTAYTTFTRRLLHDSSACDHLMLINLVTGCIKKYQDAKPTISYFLILETMKRSYVNPSGWKQVHKKDDKHPHEAKWSHIDKRHPSLKPALPILLAPIF